MPRPANRSSTFPTPTRGTWCSASRSSSVGARRRQAEVLSVGGPDPRPRLAGEGTGDDPRHAVLALQHRAGGRAGGVQLRRAAPSPRAPPPGRRCRPRCRRSSCPVRRCSSPKLVEHLRARGGRVAEHAAAGALENSAISVGRETLRIRGERNVDDEPAELPVPGDAVLPGADRLGDPVRGPRRGRRGVTPASGAQQPRPSASRLGSASPPTARATLPEGVAAGVAVGVGVRRRRRCPGRRAR